MREISSRVSTQTKPTVSHHHHNHKVPLENPLVWDACEKGTYLKVPDNPRSKELLENEEGKKRLYKK